LEELEETLKKCISNKDLIRETAQSRILLGDKYATIDCPLESHETVERFLVALNDCSELLAHSVEDLSVEFNLHKQVSKLVSFFLHRFELGNNLTKLSCSKLFS